jgi:hypothetical protein
MEYFRTIGPIDCRRVEGSYVRIKNRAGNLSQLIETRIRANHGVNNKFVISCV